MKQFVVYLCCGSPENTLSRNHTTGTHLSLVFWKSTHKISEQYLISPPKIIKKNQQHPTRKKQTNKQKTQTKTPKQTKNLTKNPSKNFKNSRKNNENTKFLTFVSDRGYQNKSLDKTAIPEEFPCLARAVLSSRPHFPQTPRGNGTERKEIGGVLPGGSSSFGVPERRWLRVGNGTEAKLGQGIPD